MTTTTMVVANVNDEDDANKTMPTATYIFK